MVPWSVDSECGHVVNFAAIFLRMEREDAASSVAKSVANDRDGSLKFETCAYSSNGQSIKNHAEVEYQGAVYPVDATSLISP